MDAVEMPDRVAENLVMFIRQNNGKFSKNGRDGEFNQLTDGEVSLIEGIVRDAFEGSSARVSVVPFAASVLTLDCGRARQPVNGWLHKS
jgi:hypothetical protein